MKLFHTLNCFSNIIFIAFIKFKNDEKDHLFILNEFYNFSIILYEKKFIEKFKGNLKVQNLDKVISISHLFIKF